MAKVYVLTTENGKIIDTRTFSTKKKAQKVMREKYNTEKSDMMSVYGKDNTAYYIGNNYANVHLCGRSVKYNIDFLITECEIE